MKFISPIVTETSDTMSSISQLFENDRYEYALFCDMFFSKVEKAIVEAQEMIYCEAQAVTVNLRPTEEKINEAIETAVEAAANTLHNIGIHSNFPLPKYYPLANAIIEAAISDCKHYAKMLKMVNANEIASFKSTAKKVDC